MPAPSPGGSLCSFQQTEVTVHHLFPVVAAARILPIHRPGSTFTKPLALVPAWRRAHTEDGKEGWALGLFLRFSSRGEGHSPLIQHTHPTPPHPTSPHPH